jgi:hypothetical protein
MHNKERLALGVVCLLALATLSCEDPKQTEEKSKVMKTAVAFYKAIEDPTPETEKVMELKDYRIYRFPALVYGSVGLPWGVEKLQGADESYQVEIPIWCHGKTVAGEEKRLRRKLLVRVAADPAAARGWTVSRFQVQGDEELTFVRQFFTWLLWMFISPMAFFLVLLLLFGGFWWPKVAFLVAQLMGLPIQIYVSYLCFGTVWGTVVAMVAWTMFQGWVANKNQRAPAQSPYSQYDPYDAR